MRISDWSSDVCSSDLERDAARHGVAHRPGNRQAGGRSGRRIARAAESVGFASDQPPLGQIGQFQIVKKEVQKLLTRQNEPEFIRSEEHTYELQTLMRISYAVLRLKKKNITQQKE